MSNCKCQQHQEEIENNLLKIIKDQLFSDKFEEYLLVDTTTNTDKITHITLVSLGENKEEEIYSRKHLKTRIIKVSKTPEIILLTN